MTKHYYIRPVRRDELPLVVALDQEAFAPYGTAERLETFLARFEAYPSGFIVLETDGEIVAYGCAEKWSTPREPGLDENPLETHQPNGKVFCITGMAVCVGKRGKGYGSAVLDELVTIARREGCVQIMLETTHAQVLYLKRGFQSVGSREQRGIRLDVMVLELGEGI